MNAARLGVCLAALLIACGATLTPADQAELTGDAAIIAKCQLEGRACKADGGTADSCYGAYDACMRDGGLR